MTTFSVKAWKEHRASNQRPDKNLYFWHFHHYAQATGVSQLDAWHKLFSKEFQADERVRVQRVFRDAFGPHPVSQFETDLTRHAIPDVLAYCQLYRPEGISILVHSFTTNQVADHSSRAMWLGAPVPMDLEVLRQFDEMVAGIVKSGVDETEAMWKFFIPGSDISSAFLSKKFGNTGL